MKNLSVIIPVKNHLEMTQKTIDNLVANTPNLGEIILIDDHSEEDFTQVKGVRYFLNKEEGVNPAWNMGAEMAQYPYIAWVNNDILFSPNWEQPLIDALNDDVWVVSPYHTDYGIPADFPLGKDRKRNREGVGPGIDFLGSCFLMTKEHWNLIGPIDPRLKIWCGDNWIYEMTRREFGKRCEEIKESYIHHLISQTLGIRNEHRKSIQDILNEDMKNFDEISVEKRWSAESVYPKIMQSIDLRYRLPMGNLHKMKVLNVGVGDMNSGIARQLPFLKFGYLHHIDVFQPYLDNAYKTPWRSNYVSFEKIDLRAVDNFDDYDLIMIFDVLEHLKKEESIAVISKIKKPLLIFGPLEKEFRPNIYNTEWQDHLSLWTEQDFIDLGFKTEVLPLFHIGTNNVRFDAIWAQKN